MVFVPSAAWKFATFLAVKKYGGGSVKFQRIRATSSFAFRFSERRKTMERKGTEWLNRLGNVTRGKIPSPMLNKNSPNFRNFPNTKDMPQVA